MNNILSKEDVLRELIPIFITVFGNADFVKDENADALSVDAWTSLNHMILMAEVEKKFGITIEPLEVLKGKSVGGLVSIIMSKCMSV